MADEVRTQHLIDALQYILQTAGEDPSDGPLKEIKDYCDDLLTIARLFQEVEGKPQEYNRRRETWRQRHPPVPGVLDNGCL